MPALKTVGEVFMVDWDLWPTPSAEMDHSVLPGTGPWPVFVLDLVFVVQRGQTLPFQA